MGDILQCLPAAQLIKSHMTGSEIHWVTREEYAELLSKQKYLHLVWAFHRKDGFLGLCGLAMKLRDQNYTHVYDAHNNLRSFILRFFLLLKFSPPRLLIRSKSRWRRLLFFKFKKKTFTFPFVGANSYVTPLSKWSLPVDKAIPSLHVSEHLTKNIQNKYSLHNPYFVLVPSAAWAMKTWPEDHWQNLIGLLLQKYPTTPLVILGGKTDQVCFELKKAYSSEQRVMNLAGSFPLLESAALLQGAKLLISADTGLMHMGDQMGIKTLALLGPTAFGHPMHPNSTPIEIDLECKPCTKDGRGVCVQKVYQKCLRDITPERVLKHIP